MDSVRLNVILEMSGENNIDLCIFMKTTDLIHDLEMRRDSFIRLQQEGKEASSKFVTFEDLQNLEQVQKWTTSKVCQRPTDSLNLTLNDVKSIKLIMFIWKPTYKFL